jgi:hypothetical protein
MAWIAVSFLAGMVVVLSFVTVRLARRLLQFDEIWQQVLPVLFDYADDLRKMVSADLLLDNPEVVALHKRNMRALREMDDAVKTVQGLTPPKQRIELPRPDME